MGWFKRFFEKKHPGKIRGRKAEPHEVDVVPAETVQTRRYGIAYIHPRPGYHKVTQRTRMHNHKTARILYVKNRLPAVSAAHHNLIHRTSSGRFKAAKEGALGPGSSQGRIPVHVKKRSSFGHWKRPVRIHLGADTI